MLRITTLLILLGLLSAPAFADKPVLGVAEFRNESSARWWGGGVGWELSGMLANELAATGAFRVVERSHLESVLREQNLAADGRIAPNHGARMGQLTGARYIVLGTVTAYSEDASSTGGGISVRGISLGGKKSEAYLSVDLRVVDVDTGELAFVRTIEGQARSSGIGGGIARGGFGGNLASENRTPAGQAIRAALMEITDYLECAMVVKGDCLAEYDAKEQRRRETTRGKLRM